MFRHWLCFFSERNRVEQGTGEGKPGSTVYGTHRSKIGLRLNEAINFLNYYITRNKRVKGLLTSVFVLLLDQGIKYNASYKLPFEHVRIAKAPGVTRESSSKPLLHALPTLSLGVRQAHIAFFRRGNQGEIHVQVHSLFRNLLKVERPD
jgi:hypothetical protein